jgi:phosphoribosylaminoimidazole-succinocarboxamide synthase
MKKIYTGKSKDIYTEKEGQYLLIFKDQMRSEDNRFSVMKGKAKILVSITKTIFEYLTSNNIPNHYVSLKDEESILVKITDPIRLECVIRRYAEGSFLKRNPSVKKHTRFETLVFEIFYKQDSLSDPFVLFSKEQGNFLLYRAKDSVSEKTLIKTIHFSELLPVGCFLSPEEFLGQLQLLSQKVFLLLEKKFEESSGVLCDLKLEFGFDGNDMLLIDSIEPDCWRLWDRDPENNLDRNDAYESMFSDEIIKSLIEKYKKAQQFVERSFGE